MSINVPLALPKTNEGILMPSVANSVVGVDHGVCRFKVARIRKSSRNKVEETTGDRNEVATIDVNQMPVTVIQLSGFLLAGTTPDNIVTAMAGNGTFSNNGTWVVSINVADSIKINGYCVIADDTWEWGQEDATVKIAMTLYLTDTRESEINGDLTGPAEPTE